MAKTKVLLYPSYVTFASIWQDSNQFYEALGGDRAFGDGLKEPQDFEHVQWDGTIESIPTGERVIIRSSSKIDCSEKDLARFAADHGHFLFWNDRFIDGSGEYHESDRLVSEGVKFMEEVRNT